MRHPHSLPGSARTAQAPRQAAVNDDERFYRYVVDFLAPAVQFIVEVDGLWHHRRVAADERRDRKLVRLGYRILHLDASLVMQQPLVAVERIREAIAAAR